MITNPIIPIWLMLILCVLILAMKRKGVWSFIRQILIVLLLFLINLRFMVPGDNMQNAALNVDVTFVIDNTISMLAEDYEGENTRMDAVKKDCRYIMEQLPGASFSVVAFGEKLKQMTPYTIDVTMIQDTISTLNGQTRLYATGTHLNDVLKDLEKVLDHGRNSYQILFFISDGEITDDSRLQSVNGLKKHVDAGAVLGYGTTGGGAMKVLNYSGEEDPPEYLTIYDENWDEQRALSKIDQDNLKQIASDFGVDYIHMEKQSDVDSLMASLKGKVENLPVEMGAQGKGGYEDIYYLFVILLVLVMVWDFVCFKMRVEGRG